MWDGWETKFEGTSLGVGVLRGYRRSFCMLEATGRWGTPDHPGLVLGLVEDAGATVEGVLFRFSERFHESVVGYLRSREGPHHPLADVVVAGRDNTDLLARALAVLSSNDEQRFVGHWPLEERIRVVRGARGSAGTCRDYVLDAADRLASLGIRDEEILAFRNALLTDSEDRP